MPQLYGMGSFKNTGKMVSLVGLSVDIVVIQASGLRPVTILMTFDFVAAALQQPNWFYSLVGLG